jgi:tRNA A37 threonylcarbamoyladenosine biosynthesis protein TsaE
LNQTNLYLIYKMKRATTKKLDEDDTLLLIGVMGQGKSTLGQMLFLKEDEKDLPHESDIDQQIFIRKDGM